MKIDYFEISLSLILKNFKDNELKSGKEYEIVAVDKEKDKVVFKRYNKED